MKRIIICLLITPFLSILTGDALAHFGMIIPSDSMVMQGDNRKVNFKISFSHPFEGHGMIMEKPDRCGVVANGNKTDLIPSLKETSIMGHKAWDMNYKINRPGVYMFYFEPKPYWEPAEDCYIIHYTKTVVAAFGEEEGWDKALGLKTEIIPLTRPFGLYVGNIFQGVVMLDGKPVPNAEVEVEFYNRYGKASAPNDYFVTQAIKSDKNGLFSYAVPKAGWWGFAGLSTSNKKMRYQGKEKDVEIGAVLWVEFQEWREMK